MLALASRNAMVLKWLCELAAIHAEHPSIFYNWVCTDYAKAFGLPRDEIVLDYITDKESLEWFWKAYHESVVAFDNRS